MLPTRLLRSTGFRLGLFHAALFALTATILFALIYRVALRELEQYFDQEIADDLASLRDQAASHGIDSLIATIGQRMARESGGYYLLQDPAGHRRAGDLPASLGAPGWIMLPRRDADDGRQRDRAHVIRAEASRLPDGSLLAVGRDTYVLNELRELLVRGFTVSGLATIALALGGGVLVGLDVRRRVETVSRAARDIMSGDLTRRITTRGRGDEFDELAVVLNAMLARIEELINDVRAVSSGIAHDLRTPLTRLRQRLERVRRRGADLDAYRSAVDRAIIDLDDVLETFGSLLRIAQIEAGTRRAGFTTVNLSALFESLFETYLPVADDLGHRLEALIEPGIETRGDPELLGQMLVNLIENALHHTPAGSRVRLGLERVSGLPVGTVADDGPGIPARSRAQVLKPFVRLDASRSRPGNGLGLSLVAAIARLHGIGLGLEDNGPGLRVVLRFRR